jgi:PleD family two-component response regulator
MQKQPKKILAVLDELFFRVKISDAAKRAGMNVEFVNTADGVLEKAKERPALIIFDLNFSALEPLDLIPKLKGNPEFKGVSLIGYLSHIQGELKQKAHETGLDMVLARSALSQNLPQILKRHAGS